VWVSPYVRRWVCKRCFCNTPLYLHNNYTISLREMILVHKIHNDTTAYVESGFNRFFHFFFSVKTGWRGNEISFPPNAPPLSLCLNSLRTVPVPNRRPSPEFSSSARRKPPPAAPLSLSLSLPGSASVQSPSQISVRRPSPVVGSLLARAASLEFSSVRRKPPPAAPLSLSAV
jgi:hypothetical protein